LYIYSSLIFYLFLIFFIFYLNKFPPEKPYVWWTSYLITFSWTSNWNIPDLGAPPKDISAPSQIILDIVPFYIIWNRADHFFVDIMFWLTVTLCYNIIITWANCSDSCITNCWPTLIFVRFLLFFIKDY
jgi:hypothetical protein